MIALGALVASGWGACAAPLEAYGKLPSIEQAAVSPSGKMVAYVVADGEGRKIAIETVPERKPVFVGPVGSAKIREIRWANDDHLLFASSTTALSVELSGSPKAERFLPFDLDLRTGRPVPLLGDVHQARGSVLNTTYGAFDVRRIDGKPVVFLRGQEFIDNREEDALFRVDLDTHFAVLAATGGTYLDYDWVIGPDGSIDARSTYDDKSGVWKLMFATPSSGWRSVEQITAPLDPPGLAGIGRDRRSILVERDDDEVGARWREVALDSGVSSDLTSAFGHQSTIHDPKDGRMIGLYSLVGDAPIYDFYDPHDAAVWRAVAKAFSGDFVELVSWSEDRKKILVLVDSADLGPAYALVDLSTGDADWLGNKYAGLKAEDVSPKMAIRFKASDGLEITGYLTLPRGREGRNLPLVVLPHGGPEARDEPGFDWWAQALASRGYAVLQPNFRGSTVSSDLRNAGYGEWGRKMQTDLSDGVHDLARQGVIDAKRVCIVGASYGGYAALAGATIDHGVYRCAVSVAGIADLRSWTTDHSDGGERYLRRFIGAANNVDPVLGRYSPVLHASEADIPVLLIHGREDSVVPIRHSREMAAALRQAGKPVELVELPGEDHWLSTGATRLKMLQATVAFLEKNNPPN